MIENLRMSQQDVLIGQQSSAFFALATMLSDAVVVSSIRNSTAVDSDGEWSRGAPGAAPLVGLSTDAMMAAATRRPSLAATSAVSRPNVELTTA